MVLGLSDDLANRSFSGSDILRVQLKSDWTVGERLLASDQWVVRQCSLILLKGQCVIWKYIDFGKKVQWWISSLIHMALKELHKISDGLANRSFCRSDISRDHLRSNWAVGVRRLTSNQLQFDNACQFYLKDYAHFYNA